MLREFILIIVELVCNFFRYKCVCVVVAQFQEFLSKTEKISDDFI